MKKGPTGTAPPVTAQYCDSKLDSFDCFALTLFSISYSTVVVTVVFQPLQQIAGHDRMLIDRLTVTVELSYSKVPRWVTSQQANTVNKSGWVQLHFRADRRVAFPGIKLTKKMCKHIDPSD